MSKQNDKPFITVECAESDHHCDISTANLKFLLDRSLLYCCTITGRMPHITPIMYYYEMDRCRISFLIDKKSVKAKNLRKNPFISLSADITHKSNPLLNSGIMVSALTELADEWDEITECLERLRRRYSSHLVPKVVDIYASQSDLCVKASIIKIVYWKGPFFQRFECPTRKMLLGMKKPSP